MKGFLRPGVWTKPAKRGLVGIEIMNQADQQTIKASQIWEGANVKFPGQEFFSYVEWLKPYEGTKIMVKQENGIKTVLNPDDLCEELVHYHW